MVLLSAVVLMSCGSGGEQDKLVTIKTSMGDMTVLLYDEAPLHKANFIELAESGKYDSTIFHRVMQDFMIQGGDIFYNKPEQETEADRIPAEFHGKFHHVKGALAAARQPDQANPEKKSSSCQFYIVHGQTWENLSIDYRSLMMKLYELAIDSNNNREIYDKYVGYNRARDQEGFNLWVRSMKEPIEEEYGMNFDIQPQTNDDAAYEAAGGGVPSLDDNYTVFGRVVEGLDVIDKIAAVQTQAISRQYQNLPIEEISITMEVESMSKSEITEKYGYEYPESK